MKTSLFRMVLLLFVLLSACTPSKQRYITNTGMIYGTYYNIKYQHPEGKDLHQEIDKELQRLSHIFSHYDSTSTISKINRNEPVIPEPEFINCFKRSLEISELTKGAFDITVGPLVDAWGFGPGKRKELSPEMVDSLKQFCGYQKVKLIDGKIEKDNPNITLNMSAIAKGYTCDLIGEFLEKNGCQNYLVDIGGEEVAHGLNPKDKIWTVGIRKPIEDPLTTELEAAIELNNKAMATSGNYLNFYEKDGKKYAHTIDPVSGYPVQHSVLSATVVAPDCMTADAYATAFMVLGKELAAEIARSTPELEIFLIFSDEQGKHQIYMSDGFDKMLKK